eukprot:4405746-Pyramimonas_sp.AAC.1
MVGGEPEVALRLVFDQRRPNTRRRSPPRRAMGGGECHVVLGGVGEDEGGRGDHPFRHGGPARRLLRVGAGGG